MSIVVVGARGSMGTRYRAILDWMCIEHVDLDIDHNRYEVLEAASHSDGVILASPTHTHGNLIETLSNSEIPLLCEKPVVTDLDQLERILASYRGRFSMVMQYNQIVPMGGDGLSYYDYFRHGRDGLAWDCFQIISLAKGEVILGEKSPVWKCSINGNELDIKDMDTAYILDLQNWLKGYDLSRNLIFKYHEKVNKYAKTFDSNSSKINLDEISKQNQCRAGQRNCS